MANPNALSFNSEDDDDSDQESYSYAPAPKEEPAEAPALSFLFEAQARQAEEERKRSFAAEVFGLSKEKEEDSEEDDEDASGEAKPAPAKAPSEAPTPEHQSPETPESAEFTEEAPEAYPEHFELEPEALPAEAYEPPEESPPNPFENDIEYAQAGSLAAALESIRQHSAQEEQTVPEAETTPDTPPTPPTVPPPVSAVPPSFNTAPTPVNTAPLETVSPMPVAETAPATPEPSTQLEQRPITVERDRAGAAALVLLGMEFFARRRADRKIRRRIESQEKEVAQAQDQLASEKSRLRRADSDLSTRLQKQEDRVSQIETETSNIIENKNEAEIKPVQESQPVPVAEVLAGSFLAAQLKREATPGDAPAEKTEVHTDFIPAPLKPESKSSATAKPGKTETTPETNREEETQEQYKQDYEQFRNKPLEELNRRMEQPAETFEYKETTHEVVLDRKSEVKDSQLSSTSSQIVPVSSLSTSVAPINDTSLVVTTDPTSSNTSQAQAYKQSMQTGFYIGLVTALIGILAYLTL